MRARISQSGIIKSLLFKRKFAGLMKKVRYRIIACSRAAMMISGMIFEGEADAKRQ
jgi:hypothetical protein